MQGNGVLVFLTSFLFLVLSGCDADGRAVSSRVDTASKNTSSDLSEEKLCYPLINGGIGKQITQVNYPVVIREHSQEVSSDNLSIGGVKFFPVDAFSTYNHKDVLDFVASSLISYQGKADVDDWLSQPTHGDRAFASLPNCSVVMGNTPNLSWPWPDHNYPDLLFDVEIRYPDKTVKTMKTDMPYLTGWHEPLPVSSEAYAWRVKAYRKDGRLVKDWGTWRNFYIPSVAQKTPALDLDALYQKAMTASRPRTLPHARNLAILRAQYIGASAPFKREWASYVFSVNDKTVNSPIEDTLPLTVTQDRAKSVDKAGSETGLAINNALAWVVTQDKKYLVEAKKRSMNLVNWINKGYFACDWTTGIACRMTVWSLALVYDWLYKDFTIPERNQIRAAIISRLNKTNGLGYFTQNLHISPLDSWGGQTNNHFVIVASLMAGEDDLFQSLFKKHVSLFLNRADMWGGDDGAFGNGLGYAAYRVRETVLTGYVFSKVTGFDSRQIAYLRNHAYYWFYLQPPVPANRIYSTRFHSPGFFGDGAEEFLISAYVRPSSNSLVSHINSNDPAIHWYAAQMNGISSGNRRTVDWLWLVNGIKNLELATNTSWSDKLPTSKIFPSIGVVAMHSDMMDLEDRVSVYFRSSRYGSISHNHADQNAVVIHKGGVPLLIDSGYYDSYGSSHHTNWYTQTKAHNAITVDGGLGQSRHSRFASGQIASFWYDPALGVTQVTGDATKAYMDYPDIKEVKRTVIYMKPETVVILDTLKSDNRRRWEWNFHAANRIDVLTGQQVRVTNQGKAACISAYASHLIEFKQNSGFAYKPAGNRPDQWHSRFRFLSPASSGKFLIVIDVGCTNNVKITREGQDIRISNGKANTVIKQVADIR